MSGILDIGTSALQAYQRALQVTGHNIANVGTAGYSRQGVSFSTRPPELTGMGAFGNGVDVVGVKRQADTFVQQRLNLATSDNAYQQTMLEFSKPVDNLLANPEASLSSSLNDFFAAAHDLTADPTSIAARQQLVSRAQSLTDRFAQLDGQIDDQRAIVNGRISTTVNEIDQLAQGVADLNRRIVESGGATGGRPANDLLDQRDQLVSQLSERVGVSTIEQSDGTINVYVGSGQSLVVGVTASTLVAGHLGADPSRMEVGLDNGAAPAPISDYLSGGRLGALFDVRESLLDPTSRELGRLAAGVAQAVNEVHTGSMDLDGNAGEAFFAMPPPTVLAAAANSATGQPALTVDDAGALEASDYELRLTGGSWRLTRQSDGQVLTNLNPGDSYSFDGLALDTSAISGQANGDVYLLQPTRAAAGLEVRVTDPRRVAAALPVRAEADAGNSGAAAVNELTVTDPSDPALRDPRADRLHRRQLRGRRPGHRAGPVRRHGHRAERLAAGAARHPGRR